MVAMLIFHKFEGRNCVGSLLTTIHCQQNSSIENNTQTEPDNFQVESSRVDEPEEDARDLK